MFSCGDSSELVLRCADDVLTHHVFPQHGVTLHPELQEFCPELQQAFSGLQASTFCR